MTEERLIDINLQLSESLDPSMLSSVYGLYNVNKRLELYYNQNSRLEISSTYKEGTRVFFKVPKGEKNV
ncbi:hypothetical protein MASR2M78_21050 [Treponema sp.]